jgi:hypothetical protein
MSHADLPLHAVNVLPLALVFVHSPHLHIATILKSTPDACHALKAKQNAYLKCRLIPNAFVALSVVSSAVSN